MSSLQWRGREVQTAMAAEENVVIIGKKSVTDYVLAAILLFNEGYDEVTIRGQGPNISKAVDVYNALVNRLQDGVELVGVNIDSIQRGRRLVPIIEIKVRRRIV
jgi:DNA-binding protein Alba